MFGRERWREKYCSRYPQFRNCFKNNNLINLNNNLYQNSVNNFSTNISNMRKEIIELSKNKEISLEMFTQIIQQQPNVDAKKSAIKAATARLQELVEKQNLPRYVRDHRYLKTTIDGKFWLSPEDGNNFDFWIDQNEVKYGAIIYCLTCMYKNEKFYEMNYIGRTHLTTRKRFLAHVKDSLDPTKLHSRLIEQAILTAIELEIQRNKRFIKLEIYNIHDYWHYLQQSYSTYIIELNLIVDLLLEEYFRFYIIEVHLNYDTAPAREKWFTKHFLGTGTINPEGLNMQEGGGAGSAGYIALPLYDIAFMIAIGYSLIEITKMINDLYDIQVSKGTVSRRIKTFWKSFEHAQELFLKSVVQALLEIEPQYSPKEIAGAINYSRQGLFNFDNSPFIKWFGGVSYTELRKTMKWDGFNWDNIAEILDNVKDGNIFRGIPKFQWIEWFIKDIGLESLAEKTGYSSHITMSNAFYHNSQFYKIFGVSLYTEAVRKYRRLKTIDLLGEGRSLEWIYVNTFGFMDRSSYQTNSNFDRQIALFFERIFDNQYRIEEMMLWKTTDLLEVRSKF